MPDTYPKSRFDRQGPEWIAPSKWKVRISSAHSLGVLEDIDYLSILLQSCSQEEVDTVRTAIALAVGAISNSSSNSLIAYLEAAQAGSKKSALNSLAKIKTSRNIEIDAELKRFRQRIKAY